MKITFSSKYGNKTVDTEEFDPSIESVSSPIFRMFEDVFNSWWNTCHPFSKEPYNEGAYTKQGAIRQAIEQAIQHCEECNQRIVFPKDIDKMDIETAFE